MNLPARVVIPGTNDSPIPHDDRPDSRIWACPPEPFSSFRQSMPHELFVFSGVCAAHTVITARTAVRCHLLVKLRFQQKQLLYYELAQLLRSGVAFPKAIRTLLPGTRGALRLFLTRLVEANDRGATIPDAFAAQEPTISRMEMGMIQASARGGRLEKGCRYLSEHFRVLGEMRSNVVRKSAYPMFLLHFGVFALGLPTLMAGGLPAYLPRTVGFLLVLYAAVAGVWLVARSLVTLAASNTVADSLLMALPVMGKLRRAFCVGRFTATYEMQLDSGVNVIDSLQGAAEASRSARVTAAVAKALPEVRQGAQVGPLLEAASVFPAELLRAFRLGEETGALHEELQRISADLQTETVRRLDLLSEWLPKLLYIGIAVYIGFQIVSFYQGVLTSYQSILQ